MCRSPLLKRALRYGEREVVGVQTAARHGGIRWEVKACGTCARAVSRSARNVRVLWRRVKPISIQVKKVTLRVEDRQNFCVAPLRLPTSIFLMKEPKGCQLAIVRHEQLVSNLFVSGFQDYLNVNHFSHVTLSLSCYFALRRVSVANCNSCGNGGLK